MHIKNNKFIDREYHRGFSEEKLHAVEEDVKKDLFYKSNDILNKFVIKNIENNMTNYFFDLEIFHRGEFVNLINQLNLSDEQKKKFNEYYDVINERV